MLTYIANEYKKKQRSLINAVCACASPREAAARGLLEMSLRRRLRKTPTILAPVLPKKALWEQQLRKVFIIVIIKYH